MAGPIALSVAQTRIVDVQCPRCGKIKLVERVRQPTKRRTCPRCKRALPPLPESAR